MKFKPGDIVIKSTGGNKMTVYSVNEKYECIWVTDKVNQDTFDENELLPLDEYKKSLKVEERDDKIGKLLG